MNSTILDSLRIITHSNIPVITTELLANLYGAEVNSIQQNFKRNAARFINGKHFFKLEGDELREYKNRLTESQSVAKHTRSLILWTERGAARHAKMLETDQEWEVFEQLEDCYFNAERANNPPQYQPEAREPLTADDASHLARLIWGMANGFRFKRSWSNAIWHALRYAAGVSSPQHFGVSHIPILAEECQRIYSFTNALKEVMYDAEKQAVRRVLKNREDADAVVSEMKQLLDETNQSHNLLLTNTLARWQQADIQHFLQRY
ncbi:MAG: ORF6N domain-containing protein [Sodalis sp. (in: enterobacteria)]|uniref:ORF6N domain-containing protein n=1 Tax=Sodalis sp. (in: enterobacteria) TaxID=1898979 RepID=UPI0039E34A0E